MSKTQQYPLLANPNLRLHGPVNHAMYDQFRGGLECAPEEGAIVIALTTLGGDPELARTMGDDVRLLREQTGREILFLGKQAVYSAGATFMSYFPREHRFLTQGTRLMIHERQMSQTINLNGPLRSCVATLKAKLHEIEHSILIEEEGFRGIAEQSDVDFETIREKAPENWYIEAEEARKLGLILDVI
ncbi:peptidase S14 [Pacificimonas flava]|uniref:Peptidase S14 n=2 Tax=Pacificimonas TaxID=1960290 RepID=A0A219B2C8_9SPHN|nr:MULTISPECIES: ATP-dependent Clp protease proteolytic subunit [Pacificimonas]MBZ6378083.1 ATP-dependent Clp protease proteolytic subunit [Pacificimonas aurantium]OWV32276.1 peptidase S14 [Pacificimonas flava]